MSNWKYKSLVLCCLLGLSFAFFTYPVLAEDEPFTFDHDGKLELDWKKLSEKGAKVTLLNNTTKPIEIETSLVGFEFLNLDPQAAKLCHQRQ